MAARAKLAQKFDAVRTGGKGTTRRRGSPALTGAVFGDPRETPKKASNFGGKMMI